MERILLCKPKMCGREIDFIKAAIADDWAVPLGPDCDAFELELETPFSHLNPDCVAGILIQGENDFRSIVQALYNVDEKALVVFGVPEVIEPMVALQYKNNA